MHLYSRPAIAVTHLSTAGKKKHLPSRRRQRFPRLSPLGGRERLGEETHSSVLSETHKPRYPFFAPASGSAVEIQSTFIFKPQIGITSFADLIACRFYHPPPWRFTGFSVGAVRVDESASRFLRGGGEGELKRRVLCNRRNFMRLGGLLAAIGIAIYGDPPQK
jgi:hypothetical protein